MTVGRASDGRLEFQWRYIEDEQEGKLYIVPVVEADALEREFMALRRGLAGAVTAWINGPQGVALEDALYDASFDDNEVATIVRLIRLHAGGQ